MTGVQTCALRSRHFTTEHSEFWRPESHEAIGGPAYKFVDLVLRPFSKPATIRVTQVGAHIIEPGSMDIKYMYYYFAHNIDVVTNDEIYELSNNNSTYTGINQPILVYSPQDADTAEKAYPSFRYKIKIVNDFRDIEGRIEFREALTEEYQYR